MKTLIAIVSLCSLTLASFAAAPLPPTATAAGNPNVMAPLASVTPTAPLPVLTSASDNPLGLGQAGNALLSFLRDAQPYWGSNSTLVYDALAIYNQGHVGGLIAAHLPISQLSSAGQIAAGTAVGYINGSWYTLSLNMQLGTTWKVPLLGNVYTAIGSGPDLSLKDGSVGAYSFASASKGWDVGSGHVLSITLGVATESHLTGPIYLGGISLGW